jgi:integrase
VKAVSVSIEKETMTVASPMSYLKSEEIVKILSVLHEEQDRLLFLVGLELGARVSEVSSLKWPNVNFGERYLVIWDEKKNKHRVCTLPENVWGHLREYAKKVDKRREDRVFPYSSKTLNRRIKQWAKDAGITRRVRWHTLRHTYVVESRKKGRDWSLISAQTGDTAATLIQEYSKLSLEDRQKMTDEKPLTEVEKHDDKQKA